MSAPANGDLPAYLGRSYSDHAGLDELRGEILHLTVLATVILAVALDLWLASMPPDVPDNLWLAVPVLLLLGGLSAAIGQHRTTAGGLVLIVGLSAVLVAAQLVIRESPLDAAYPLVVFLTSALLGLGAGAVMAGGISLALLMVGSAISGNPALGVFAVWASVLLFWVVSRPTRVALDWAWHSYTQLLERTGELQNRQGELAQLSKSLTEAVYRLERANLELDRARQAANEARRAKAEFAAMISHELRTPLNLVIGFSEMILRGIQAFRGDPVLATVQSDLEAIYRNACHLSNLANDVLDLSQVEARRLALRREQVALDAIVDEAVTTVAAMFQAKGLRLEIFLADDLPILFVDRTRVRQILINLLCNAVRFTDEGGVRISARLDEGQVVVSVTDTGIGIAPADLPHVFEEFHQLHPHDGAAWRRQVGSGLGLSICRYLTELHGGTIWVESEPGHGSTFFFSLPLADNVRIPATPHDYSARFRVRPGSDSVGTVVVVGEDRDAARILQRYLDGYQVVVAESAVDLEKIAAQPLRGAIVTTNGGSLLWTRAQRLGSGLASLPVVRLSLQGTESNATHRLGIAAYLVKPIDAHQLVDTVQQLIDHPRRLLIVEDDIEMGSLIRRIIESRFPLCQIDTASDGDEALDRMRDRCPDVVILDLLMPRLDGYAVIEEMQHNERLRGVPVVVVAAHDHQEQPVVAASVAITRQGGLSIRELAECLRGSFDAMTPAVDNVSPRR